MFPCGAPTPAVPSPSKELKPPLGAALGAVGEPWAGGADGATCSTGERLDPPAPRQGLIVSEGGGLCLSSSSSQTP